MIVHAEENAYMLQDIKTETESDVHMSEDVKPFQKKSFGCGICDEMFETEAIFQEHCSSHCLSPPADLFC